MDRRKLSILLCVEGAVCLILGFAGKTFGSSFQSISAFPFSQIALGLRLLSLSGAFGNAAALVLYAAVCLLPAALLARRMVKQQARCEDALLALLCVLLFAALYMMINPSLIAEHFAQPVFVDAAKSLFGIAIYSVIAGYAVFRMLRKISGSDSKQALGYLKILFAFIAFLLVFEICYSTPVKLIDQCKALAAGNTARPESLGLSYTFIVLQSLVAALPVILNLAIVFSAIRLTDALEKGQFDESVPVQAKKTGDLCKKSVAAILMSQIALNTIQIMLGSKVLSSNLTLSLPLLSIAFVLIMILLTKYFEQAKRLKDDNESFI